MKNRYTLIFFALTTSFLTAQTTTNFKSAEGYADGALSNNTNWGGQFFFVNTTNQSVATQSNTADAFWGQSQSISVGETITFEVDMKFGGDLGYTANTFIAQIGFNAGGTTSSGGSDRQFIYLKALTDGKLKMERRAGGNLQSTPSYSQGPTIDTWKNEDLTAKVSFLLGNSASTSTITAKLINRTTGEFTDASFDQNGIFSTSVYNGAVSGNLYGFFRTVTLQDGDASTTESFSVSSVKLINEDTLFPNIFSNTTNDNQWATAANWDSGKVPSSYTDVSITSTHSIQAGSSTTAVANKIVIDSGGSLTVDETSSLTVSDEFTNNGTVTLNSGGSLIVNGSSSGDVTYNRTLNFISGNDKGWHLVGSPVASETYDNAYANDNSLATSGTKRGLAAYNTSSDTWTYLEDNDSNAGAFTSGIGYSLKRASTTGAVSFIGTINTADVTPSVVAAGNGFNLVSNPYTSYINSGAFLTENTANLVSETIWLWDPISENYQTKVTLDAFALAPGQGFFVKASGASVNFLESNQASGTDTFQKSSSTRPEIKLMITNGSLNRFAKLYYLDNATTGFDNGCDGATFTGGVNSFDIYTNLLENNQGESYQLQALPYKDLESMIIPLGLITSAIEEITFTADVMNLPPDIKVFLEDRLQNTFTRLDQENTKYEVTLAETNGAGRFFIHTTQSVLSVSSDALLTSISVYKLDNSKIRIAGLSQGETTVKLFNILGKQVVNTSFSTNGVNDISLPKLARGVYIVNVNTETGQLNKKIIIE
ncbi:MAG: T9SS type A sorting domain-containing protein [Polaribacter sp.]|nr:T9SS type A sorting domain-containing protein [Polaribacter sp.]